MADRVLVAEIGAAHGIRGEVRLRSFTQDPLAVKDYGPLESEDGAQRFAIESLRPAKDMPGRAHRRGALIAPRPSACATPSSMSGGIACRHPRTMNSTTPT